MRLRLSLLSLLASVLAATILAVAAGSAAAADRTAVSASLTKLYAKLGGSRSVTVVDADSGETIFQRRPNAALVPASNEKLIVTATALLRFGPSATLDTTVHTGPRATLDAATGVLTGDVYLVGGGDPLLGDAGLNDLAGQLRSAGVRRITGGIVGDESLFDRRRGGPDSGYAWDGDLGGALSALAWQHGSAASGSPALTAARRFARSLKARKIRYGRAPRTGALPPVARAVQGGALSTTTTPATTVDPGATAPDAGETPPASLLATTSSPPMRDVVAAINVPSQNFYAEMLLKAIGARYGSGGTTSAGAKVATATLAGVGVKARVVDGSGLTRRNRVSSADLVKLLIAMRSSDAGPAFRASLPVAGLSGTLRTRMRGTAAAGRCRAKTGTLRGISSLSGYCTTVGGREVAFSFLENRVCNSCAKAVENRMVASIARLD